MNGGTLCPWDLIAKALPRWKRGELPITGGIQLKGDGRLEWEPSWPWSGQGRVGPNLPNVEQVVLLLADQVGVEEQVAVTPVEVS